MKKLFAILMVMTMICIPVSIYADEIPIDTEVAETEPIEVIDTVPDNISEEDKQGLIDVLDRMSPKAVDQIKEILKVGIESINSGNQTTWDKISAFMIEHITEISYIIFALILVLYIFYERSKQKAFKRSASTLNNNAIEIAQNSEKKINECMKAMRNIDERMKEYLDTVQSTCEKIELQTANVELKKKEIEELKNNISASAESSVLLSDIMNELLQLSNIPQNKKDAIHFKYVTAKQKVLETREQSCEGLKDEEDDETQD